MLHLMMLSGQPGSPGTEGAKQLLLNHWTEARECSQLSHSAGKILGYVRFCVSCKPHTAWPGWLEWVGIKVCIWPSHKPYGDHFLVYWVHCPPFSALLWVPGSWPVRTLSNGSFAPWLPVGWSSGSPSRRSVEERDSEANVPLVIFLQAGQSSVRCPSQADFSDFGSCSHTFLSPLLTYPQKWWYAYFITSAGLLQSSL